MNKAKTNMCPVCCEGNLHELTYTELASHSGQSGEVTLCISKCDSCNSELPTDAQLLKNRRTILAFEKKAEKRLQGFEVRKIRLELGLTQSQASIVFGGGRNAFSKYESDDVCQSGSMDKLLKLCHEVPAAYDWLISESGLPIKPRSATPSLWRNMHVHVVEGLMRTLIKDVESVSTLIERGRLPQELARSKIMKQHVEYYNLPLPAENPARSSAIPRYSEEVYDWQQVKGIHS